VVVIALWMARRVQPERVQLVPREPQDGP
jgi:hypothetical protein